MTTDPPALYDEQLYGIISAAIDAGVSAEAAADAIDDIFTESNYETEQGSEE